MWRKSIEFSKMFIIINYKDKKSVYIYILIYIISKTKKEKLNIQKKKNHRGIFEYYKYLA